MSGVIDNNGQQWERCNQCGATVKIQLLHFGPIRAGITPRWPNEDKLDLCKDCIDPAHANRLAKA